LFTYRKAYANTGKGFVPRMCAHSSSRYID